MAGAVRHIGIETTRKMGKVINKFDNGMGETIDKLRADVLLQKALVNRSSMSFRQVSGAEDKASYALAVGWLLCLHVAAYQKYANQQ